MTRCSAFVGLLVIVPLLLAAHPSAGEPDIQALAKGNTEFALDIYGELRTQPGNLFLSPYSISSALAMTYAGARYRTAAQMADVLNFTEGDENLHASFATITEGLEGVAEDSGVELRVANALWGQQGMQFLNEFIDLNEEYYEAGLEHVDFTDNTEEACKIINAWVAKETKERIKELLSQDVLGPSTQLVLTNAIYFKGDWASGFDKDKTEARDFWVTPDSSVTVQMMRRRSEYKYNETETLKALELPYVDGSFSMIVLLPKERDGLAEIESSLDPMSLGRWLGLMRERMIIAEIPRFTVQSDFRLHETLKTMGMTDAFDPKLADFSGMTGTKELFIDAVIHQAFLEVNEEGSEAAAGTAVEMKKRYPVFRVDHPFLFIIRDNDSGSILFMGRVADPTR